MSCVQERDLAGEAHPAVRKAWPAGGPEVRNAEALCVLGVILVCARVWRVRREELSEAVKYLGVPECTSV